MNTHKALVVRVTESGVVYANDQELNTLTAFSFGQIDGYKGQSAKELKAMGLYAGTEVTVEYSLENQVNTVSLATR